VKSQLRRILAATIVIALLASATPALAAPATAAPTAQPTPQSDLAAKQAEAQRIENEISILDQALEMVVEEFNATREGLKDTNEKLKTAQLDYKDAQQRYEIQKEVFNLRLESLYRNGDFSQLEVILTSRSITDLLKRINFLQKMADRDAQILSEVGSERDQIEQVQSSLASLRVEQEKLQAELSAKQKEIQTQLAARQKKLATISADIQAILDTEEARRKAEQDKLLASILDKTNSMGITATPGSVVWTALQYLGVPYVWGGTTPRGFDCSGLAQYVYAKHGVALPRVSYQQAYAGEPVNGELMPADLVFFGNPIHHVGIYIGGGYFVHAPRTGDVVKITKLSDPYYGANYAWARRIQVANPY